MSGKLASSEDLVLKAISFIPKAQTEATFVFSSELLVDGIMSEMNAFRFETASSIGMVSLILLEA